MSKFNCDIVELDEVLAKYQVKDLNDLDSRLQKDQQIAELKQQLEEVQDFIKLFDCDNFDEFKSFIAFCRLTPHEQETLILNLQKKLHIQPKEIVEKIKKKLSEANFDIVSKNDGYSYTNNFLEQILKEYEEK